MQGRENVCVRALYASNTPSKLVARAVCAALAAALAALQSPAAAPAGFEAQGQKRLLTAYRSFNKETERTAQLDDILEKFPATTYPMLAIDVKPSGSGKTEALTLPSNRELWVHLPGDGKYTPKYNGLIISFF